MFIEIYMRQSQSGIVDLARQREDLKGQVVLLETSQRVHSWRLPVIPSYVHFDPICKADEVFCEYTPFQSLTQIVHMYLGQCCCPTS